MTLRVSYLVAFIVCIAMPSPGSEQPTRTRLESYRMLSREAQGASEGDHLSDKCGLPTLSAALHDRMSLPPELQSSLSSLLLRPSLDTSILVGGFRIHFDTVGANAPAMLDSLYHRIPGTVREYVDSVAAILQYTTSVQTNTLGYLQPPQDFGNGGGTQYDIYIGELGSSYYGLTTPETPINSKPDGGTFTTFLEIDNDFSFVFPDSNKGMPALRVTIAHELHHAVQIGNYGYWTGDSYFYEITSVWMEDVVYTNVNDYYQYLRSSQGQFWHPETPFTSNSFIMYSRGIWGSFVEKRYGRDVMRTAWEEIRNVRPLQAMDNALQLSHSTFREAFAEWTLWNFFTESRADTSRYYPEGYSYPLIVQSPIAFAPPSRAMGGSLAALSARYYQVIGLQDTLTLALSNINFNAGIGNSSTQFPYTYLLNTLRVDDSYRATSIGIFFKLDVVDVTNWYTWDVVGVGVGSAPVTIGIPFPNPFIVGTSVMFFPINAPSPIEGTLSVFTGSMDLVFTSTLTSETRLGKQAFVWNGKTSNGEIVQSGVYLFVLDVQDQLTTGKIAVIRK